jgi:hypothetical protein
LAFTPADAWPGETEVFAEAEPEVLAVCERATMERTPAAKTLLKKCFIWSPYTDA